MTILFWSLVIIVMVGATVGNAIIFSFFRVEREMLRQARKSAEVLEKAQELYSKGDWAGALSVMKQQIKFPDREDRAEACRIAGWSHYFLGIKGSGLEKYPNLKKSKYFFELALNTTHDDKRKMSIMNGLPLALWILGELPGNPYRLEAFRISEQATQLFSEEPSVWNTRSILLRWKGDDKGSIDVCDKVYWTARQKGDWLTAGHGQQNRGDALKKIGDIFEASLAYELARTCYQKYEEMSEKSATAHISSVNNKLAELEAVMH